MRLLLLADMHIGSIKDTIYYYNVVTDIIEKEVELNKTDAVIILGDYFDRLFRANEDYVSLAINIMSYLVRACAKNHTKIRLIYGTESHEMNQYKLFNHHFSSKKVDMKLITTCTEEELFPNVNVLYLPEEYIDDKHDFYKNTLYEKKYDYIFGHGNIVEGMPSNMAFHTATKKTNEKQVPRFNKGELMNASKLCVFGHVHTFKNLDNRVYYLGSLFRNSFGEEDPKGYGIIDNDKLTFIENNEAYLYKTYEFNPSDDVYKSNDDMITAINAIKKENEEIFNGEKYGKIRIVFNTPSNTDPTFYDNVKNILSNDKLISPLIKESNQELIEEAKADVDDEYEFVLDNSLNIINKIHMFISKINDNVISLDDLNNYIKNPLEI